MIYVDTSAAFKLLSRENGVEAVESLFDSGDTLFSSRLLELELHTIVTRRGGDPAAASAVLSHIALDALDDEVLGHAVAMRSGLRSLDALHLATASLHRDRDVHFATFDRELAEAAERHGIPAYAWT